jgi:hypothetical protein
MSDATSSLPRIFKTGATRIVEDETMTGLSHEEIRALLKPRFPEVAYATIHEREVDGHLVVEFRAKVGRKG